MKITLNHSKFIWKSDFKSFSPFRIVGMVVHMLDPAVWEVNRVGSHLANEIVDDWADTYSYNWSEDKKEFGD